jgi:uncharacterized protein
MAHALRIPALLALWLLCCPPGSPAGEAPQKLPVAAGFTMGEVRIDLEVARTPREMALGLMHRHDLPDDRGMLFAFKAPTVARFWMKNVPIPLDMIFLRRGEIIHIARSVPPCRSRICPVYGPASPVDQVIELGGGRAEELGLKEGGRIEVEFAPYR